MKTYTLKARRRKDSNIQLTIGDLIPIPHKRHYSFIELTDLVNYSNYQPDWDHPMKEEYAALYRKRRNVGIDFFKVRGHDLIVIPGEIIHPTLLTEQDIKGLDLYRKISTEPGKQRK